MHEVIKPSEDPTYTVFVPFTRLWLVDEWLKHFETLQLPKQSTELVFYNDTDIQELRDKLYLWLDLHADDFNGAVLYSSMNPLLPELGDGDLTRQRRDRIVAMKKDGCQYIGDSVYTFCLEDDTFAPPNAFVGLLNIVASDNEVALASGIEMGRWAIPIIGAWKVHPLEDPQVVSTVPYKEWGTQEVDGCGWYCLITYTSLYKRANYRYEAECLGPDVMYALDLRRNGYKVIADWTIVCEHRDTYGSFIPTLDNTKSAKWNKVNGTWIMEVPSNEIRISL